MKTEIQWLTLFRLESANIIAKLIKPIGFQNSGQNNKLQKNINLVRRHFLKPYSYVLDQLLKGTR